MEYLSGNEDFIFGMTMRTKDYGWEDINENARKVLIVNPNDVKGLDLMSWVAAFKDSGHSEWEFLWAALIVNAVREAAAEGKDEADVTYVFDRSFIASGDRKMTADEVYKHCSKIFEVVEETPAQIKVKVKAA